MAKRKRSRALALTANETPAPPQAASPIVENTVPGLVHMVELQADGTRRVTYQPVKSMTEAPDGSRRWEYYRPEEK